MLAYQAWLMCDAIGRTLWRVFVTRRHMLEWMPADLLGNMRNTFGGFYARMFRGVLLALGAGRADHRAGAAAGCPDIALPFLLLWLAAPAIAWRISQTPPAAAKSELTAEQQRELRLIARRTWRFFETFVTAEDNHLPPDNFQEDPRPVVAHRTSPTNIGLYLLSVVAARDFGWCGLRDALDRIEATLGTVARMATHRGHLYNWYDTRDLRPLEPRYVSSVDSGNLAAHLITLAAAFRQWQQNPRPRRRRPWPDSRTRSTWRARRCASSGSIPARPITRELLETAFADLDAALRPRGRALDPQLDDLAHRGRTRLDPGRPGAHAGHETHADRDADLVYWVEAARRTIDSWRSDLLARDPAGFIVEHLETLATTALELAHAHGVRLPARHAAQAAVDRLPRHRRHARPFLLRPAGVRGAAGELHRHRQGRHARASLVPAGPHRDTDRRRRGAGVLVGIDVRVPDAGPGAARAGRQSAGADQPAHRQAPDRSTARSWTCPGASPNRHTTRAISSSPISTRTSACPGLGLKRGLSENKVVAPYATGLAAMVDGEAALTNYRALAAIGARGRYGFYEAVDFTPSRVPEGADVRAGALPTWRITRA